MFLFVAEVVDEQHALLVSVADGVAPSKSTSLLNTATCFFSVRQYVICIANFDVERGSRGTFSIARWPGQFLSFSPKALCVARLCIQLLLFLSYHRLQIIGRYKRRRLPDVFMPRKPWCDSVFNSIYPGSSTFNVPSTRDQPNANSTSKRQSNSTN